jgi:broad specificity phosphatase PhoE
LTVEIIFEYHSTSEDNEAGVASGWRDPALSPKGRQQAADLGQRRRGERIDAVFCSDLKRAVETAEIAFRGVAPIRRDRRLREYDYGTMTGMPTEVMRGERPARVYAPFPDGESLRDVVERVRGFLDYAARRCDGQRIVIIGHGATKLALDHLLAAVPLDKAASDTFVLQPIPPSYRYTLEGGQ